MKISVIIPALNRWELTRACLESLRACTPEEAGADIEVVLIDNASTDATAAEAPDLGAALFGAGFIYLPQPVNRNFSASCNLGARAATGELLFFLNNDTLLTPGWLPPLLEALAGPGAPSFVGPLLLYPELGGRADRVQHLGIVFDPQLHPKHLYEGFPARHPLCSKVRRLQAITGAALLLSRDLFLSAGLFDEAFINGGEDVEFGLRLGKMGHFPLVAHDSGIYHLASQTPGIHAHAVHNAKVLRERALGSIVPDLAPCAARDGYVFRLSPGLAGYFDLPEERAARFARDSGSLRDEAALTELLDKEPLWHQGYAALAALQETSGNLQAAAATLFMALRFKPDPRPAARLLALAARTRNSKYASYAKSILDWYKPENFGHALNTARFMREFCAESGQPAAAEAYADWLDKGDEYEDLYEELGRPASPNPSAGG